MRRLSLSRAWDETKAIIARDGKLFVSVALALIVLPQTIAGVLAPTIRADSSALAKALVVAVILIGFVAQIAIARLAIGPSTTVGAAIARGLSRVVFVFLALLLVGVVFFVLLILVGILLGALGVAIKAGTNQTPPLSLILLLAACTMAISAILQLTLPIAAAESGGPIRLLRRSWQLARSDYLLLLAFVVLVFIGVIFVALATQFLVGSLILMLVGPPTAWSLSALLLGLVAAAVQGAFTIYAAVMLARIYVQLAGRGEAEPGVPSTGH